MNDSEVVAYVQDKIRHLAITAAELAEEAASAARELITLRQARDAYHMTIAACTWTDKALLLTGHILTGPRNITDETTRPTLYGPRHVSSSPEETETIHDDTESSNL